LYIVLRFVKSILLNEYDDDAVRQCQCHIALFCDCLLVFMRESAILNILI